MHTFRAQQLFFSKGADDKTRIRHGFFSSPFLVGRIRVPLRICYDRKSSSKEEKN
jgi:hypothetical protein